MSLQSRVRSSLSFYKPWQQAIDKCSIADNDYIPVMLLVLFYIPIQHKIKKSESDKFINLCFENWMKYLISSSSSDDALKKLSQGVDDLYFKVGIDPESADAKLLKDSIQNLANNILLEVNHVLGLRNVERSSIKR